jgi:hypothetical protein
MADENFCFCLYYTVGELIFAILFTHTVCELIKSLIQITVLKATRGAGFKRYGMESREMKTFLCNNNEKK